ncbi:hypothetical protein KCU77_g17506, partial [Aureobasidium melanogenum]
MPTSIPKLPLVANSTAGLEFIGFTHATATHIFSTYSKYKLPSTTSSADNEDFFFFIHGHIIMMKLIQVCWVYRSRNHDQSWDQ